MTLTESGIRTLAAGHGATPAQIALAWLLGIADNVLLIPGTSSRGHLAENLADASLSLHNDEICSLTSAFGTT
jgi:pyridoxine 4-dehydrogenase